MSIHLNKINLGGRDYLVIDLNKPFRGDEEVIPGDPKSTLNEPVYNIREHGFNYFMQRIGDHSFRPHFDSQNHQNPELQDRGAETWGLDRVFNSA